MNVKAYIVKNRQQYLNIAAKCRLRAANTDDPIQRAGYLARASAYDIVADDMLEILDCAEDIRRG